MYRLITLLIALLSLPWSDPAQAQLSAVSDFTIRWQVVNGFRLFRDPAFFKLHENAWRQYLLYVDGLHLSPDERDRLVAQTSVLGSEHVLNDRHIAFTQILRDNFDWRGWAARNPGILCYDSEKRSHSSCGGIDNYVNPDSHPLELWLTTASGQPITSDHVCQWQIDGQAIATTSCSRHVSGDRVAVPYPHGADISVSIDGGQPIMLAVKVRDILIAGLGDSFASGDGNPNLPVEFSDTRRFRSLYPLRRVNDASGSATWSDRLCHRSLYGQQLRIALQIAIENRQAAVTFLDYSCSGASVDEGILGPQTYVERESTETVSSAPAGRPLSGGRKDSQLYRLLKEICETRPEIRGGLLVCPDERFRRPLDLVLLSVGGNDIGFSSVVAWATLRDNVSASVAKLLGATISASQFSRNINDVLPDAFARLSKAMEASLPLFSASDRTFDPSRIILTAYPDVVTGSDGEICATDNGGKDPPDLYPANQSLDMFASWLEARDGRLRAVRNEFAALYRQMRNLAGDHGWTFAGRAYSDQMFVGHGFCAQDRKSAADPAEALMIPCWGEADRPTQTCQASWSGKSKSWRPYNPATQNFPYALRQRWVRTFNDAYMIINQKVVDRFGNIDEAASAGVFSETTGALHPSAEGHAAMADAALIDIRSIIHTILSDQ